MASAKAMLAAAASWAVVAAVSATPGELYGRITPAAGVNTTTCAGKTYVYEQLGGYGFIPSTARDKFGDTIGGIGSAIALDTAKWTRLPNGTYTGVLWAQPDRGWNTQGTLNFIPRVHKFAISFTPQEAATAASPSAPNLAFTYLDTILYFGPDGRPTTGLDADGSGHLSYPGFPDLPVATYTGDGFGSNSTGCGGLSRRIPIDAEGLVLNADGSFWVSDEYGPYIYHFDASGHMTAAIRPNEAIIPKRNGSDSFSADSPPHYVNNGAGDDVYPADNPTGRDNNHGFEGLAVADNGNTLWVLLQAATNQEGGLNKQTQRYTRLVKYDVSDKANIKYLAEFVVALPLYNDPTAKASKNPKAAAQSELHALPNGQFLVLARDSSAGHGQAVSTSVYRQIDVFDLAGATDIKAAGGYDCATCAAANSTGFLAPGIVPATYCPFLDFNVNSQLNRFGVHNGGAQDQYLLNEKWESIGMVPVDPSNPTGGEYYIFSLSDNDFITQNGYLKGGRFQYADASTFNLDNQALVFKVSIPS